MSAEGLNLRKIPKINVKHDIPILRSHKLKAGVKRLLRKWYIGKLPIPQREKKKPRPLSEELRNLAKKEEKPTRGKK